jgi:ATP-dependent DNA helicase RecG
MHSQAQQSKDEALDPDAPLTELEGIGPARARALARRGLSRVRDLCLLAPRDLVRWEERVPIAEALRARGKTVTIAATVESARLTRWRGARSIFCLRCTDASSALDAVFFNQPWLRERFVAGMQLEIRGSIPATGVARLVVESVGTSERPLPPPGSLVPHYPAFEGLSPAFVGRLVQVALACADSIVEPLPAAQLAPLDLPPLALAVRYAHAPETVLDYERGRARLALEPLLAFQARLARRREEDRRGRARSIVLTEAEHARALASFPFRFTEGQSSAVDEIRADLSRSRPMRRLLQGDVGCGKTAVAAWAALAVAARGGQIAFLAPTELLAEQHHQVLAPRFLEAGVRSVLLTGSLPRAERTRVLAELASGRASLAFGTHALFSAEVRYARLDLAIIDEQQRFGVGQRLALAQKGEAAHLLLLTATPIPRTLAHTLYADLDVSTIQDRPADRGSSKTSWVRGEKSARLQAFLAERLEAGERAFWVCPRIGEGESEMDEQAASTSAVRRAKALAASPLARYGVALVHGGLERDERARVVEDFRAGRSRLLVATSVIEVGVDVPEASVMVVEGAERFGLAQLHQLRGRIGRGPQDSWCLLLGKPSAAERLELLEREPSGFAIAEADLRLRGMGELAGLRQSGLGADDFAGGEGDLALLILARDLMRADPALREHYAAGCDNVDAP